MKRHTGTGQQTAKLSELCLALPSCTEEEQVGLLSDLCAALKTEKAKETANGLLKDRTPLYNALKSGAPKARKNAARVLGALCDPADAPELMAALGREEVRFVRPSLILALGAVGGEGVLDFLAALPVPASGEDKHDQEEALAIMAAVSRLKETKKHPFTGFTKKVPAMLEAPAGFGPLLAAELDSLNIPHGKSSHCAVHLSVQDIAPLFKARCFTELLFPLGQIILPYKTPKEEIDAANAGTAAAAAVRVPLLSLLQDCHQGEPPFTYRVECKLTTDRKAFAKAFAARLDREGKYLLNSPSAYEAEIRITPSGEFNADVSLKLYTIADTRFAYRKHAISASMHPATAAALCRYVGQFLPEKPIKVLDPCCGSGTLLIEAHKLFETEGLLGLDIAGPTVNLARENCKEANCPAKVLHTDCRTFTVREPVDLVISNLPFGTRVGTHKDNEALYADIVKSLPSWLAPGGIAILYTMEYTLLKKCLKQQKGLAFVAEARTAAGGLLPWALVVRRV